MEEKTDKVVGYIEYLGAGGMSGEIVPCTREEMVTMLYRFAASQNMDTTTTGDLSSFTDASSVQSYATEPMTWAVGNGIILGMGNNELAPRESATRAQFAAITARLAALK